MVRSPQPPAFRQQTLARGAEQVNLARAFGLRGQNTRLARRAVSSIIVIIINTSELKPRKCISNKTPRRLSTETLRAVLVSRDARVCMCFFFFYSDKGARIYIALTRPSPWPVNERNETSCFVYKHKRACRERESVHTQYFLDDRQQREREREREKKTSVCIILKYFPCLFDERVRWAGAYRKRMIGGNLNGPRNDERYNIVYI